MKTILSILGCTPIYEVEVTDIPVQMNHEYIYTVKLRYKIFRVFGIKVKKIKIENDYFKLTNKKNTL